MRFDDLEWPQTPVSRSQYSLKVNILQMVHATAILYTVSEDNNYIFKWHERRVVPQQQLSCLFSCLNSIIITSTTTEEPVYHKQLKHS